MFRLIIALGVAAVLLPAETVTGSKRVEAAKVTTYETFSAAQALYSDVSSFCERNVETCITGKALATNAVTTIRASLNQLAQGQNSPSPSLEVDLIKTSAITK